MNISALALYRITLAAEAAAFTGLTALLLDSGQPVSALTAAMGPVIWRLAYAAVLLSGSYLLFRRAESTTPLTPAWFRLLAHAAPAIFRNQWNMAFPPAPPRLVRTPHERDPLVLLIHGYACNPGCFDTLPHRLSAHGVETRAITLSDPTGDIGLLGAEAAHWIGAIHAEAPHRRLVIVGISMGGLVARAALVLRPDIPINHLLTISSPHAGTWLAYSATGIAAKQMRPGSVFLAQLDATRPTVPTTALWTPDDTIILPPDSGKLAGAESIAIPGYTHLAVIEAPEVEQQILRVCRTPAARLSGSPAADAAAITPSSQSA